MSTSEPTCTITVPLSDALSGGAMLQLLLNHSEAFQLIMQAAIKSNPTLHSEIMRMRFYSGAVNFAEQVGKQVVAQMQSTQPINEQKETH